MANNSCPSDMQLILDDNYISEVRTYINAAAIDANRKLDVLIETLKKASADGCIKGETAEVLKLFAERTSQLSGLILEYGKECASLADEFLSTIDNIDGDLY